jgi:hypothetical protein
MFRRWLSDREFGPQFTNCGLGFFIKFYGPSISEVHMFYFRQNIITKNNICMEDVL